MDGRRPRLLGWSLAALALLAACATPPVAPEGVGDTAAHHYAIGKKLLEEAEGKPPAARRDNLMRAIEEFVRARELDPNFAPAWEGAGLVLLDIKKYDDALEAFRTAKEKDSKYVPAYLGLARTYAIRGDAARARHEAEAAVKLEPRNARTHLVLGEVSLQAFDFTRAETSFSRALELEPTSGEARRQWDRSVRIRQAAPGTLVGKKIALADPITRGELATLLASELGIEERLRRRRPEAFDPSFRPPCERPVTPARPAPADVDGHWARNAIELVLRLDLMELYPDRKFRPDEAVTRAAFAGTIEQVLSVATNDPLLKTRYVGERTPFPDVRSDHFAFNAVMVATTRGLLEAEKPSGAFRLTRPVSGAEALLAMRKLAELF